MYEKGKKIFVFLCLLFASEIFGNNCPIYAGESLEVSDFIGFYLCDVDEVGEYQNPQVMELNFNQKNVLTRYDGLYFGTTGTTVCYNYTNTEITGNILTCYYDGAYGSYGRMEDIAPGSHKFILTEDRNLLEGNHIWYRYEREVTQKEKEPGTLMNVTDIDFPNGDFTGKAGFLGNTNIQRRKIEEITFLNSISEKAENAWDVSVDGDESVWAWTDNIKGKDHVYIAADGGVTANGSCDSLFRCCTDLKIIHFNGAFDTGHTGIMDSMFEECRSLEKIEGIEQLDTSEANFMYAMFAGCKKLQYLDLFNFDTSNVAAMNKMFYGCSKLKKLDISKFDFSCVGSGDLSDMFIGTKWEGSSPLLDEETKDIKIAYMLDVGTMMKNNPVLRAAVMNAYDKKIGELSQEGLKLSKSMYALKDMDSDGIPELLIKSSVSGGERRIVYTFSIPICQVRLCMAEIKQADFLSAHFRYVIPKYIAGGDIDIDADGIEEEIDVKVSCDEEGYDYLVVYVDSLRRYDRQIESEAAGIEADVKIYSWEKSNGIMYLRIYAPAVEEYCGILRYDGDKFTEIANLKDLIDVSQLRNNGLNCYFKMQTEKKENSNIQLEFALEPFIWGNKLKISMDYRYADGKLIQVGNLYDIESYEYDIFAGKRMELLDSVNGGNVNTISEEGEKVILDKACLFKGKLWFNLKKEDGTSGWIKMENAVFSEYGYIPETSEKERAGQKEEIEQNEEKEDTVIWKNEESITNVKKILLQALKKGNDNLWHDYSNFSYSFSDINRDGQPEMVVKGKAKDGNEYLFAVYVYDKADKTVRKIGDFISYYENFYYSPKYSALVTFRRSSGNEEYTFYMNDDNKMTEDFTVSWHTDKVTRFYNYKKEGVDKLLKEVPYPEKDEKLWDSYIGDFRELKFKQTEKAFGN